MSDVIVRRHGAAGHISLDRPKALHALTQAMCETISAALLEWRDDPGVGAVILDHAGGRGFCAGGDVAMVRRSALEDGGAAGRAFFHAEYRMNHLLFTYPKPVIAFMDGVTMGGGVGLALPCRWRVATENTLFAMPEGAIGLFPDVGAGWYLPRLHGRIGQFLALTGARLDGAECRWAGLATHYLPGERLAEAKAV
ncbi:MAG TPA: enoyl-CoA hydratase/isomerase family protein, partial [Croceibacterium sp.]